MNPSASPFSWNKPLALAIGLHLGLVGAWAAAWIFQPTPLIATAAQAPLFARIIQDNRPAQAAAEPTAVAPASATTTLPARRNSPAQSDSKEPPTTASTALQTKPTANPMPAATETSQAVQANTQQALIEPRFDVDVLQNPKPPYPSLSRRLGEEGLVLLRVRVTETGEAGEVRILKSSGYPRLDEVSKDTVARWRFVPARRGTQVEAAWVQVPIDFTLKR